MVMMRKRYIMKSIICKGFTKRGLPQSQNSVLRPLDAPIYHILIKSNQLKTYLFRP